MRLNKIFQRNNNIIIGVIHFPPLLGYSDFPGFQISLKNAVNDLKMFEMGGVDGIIFENNYDIPHKPLVGHTTSVSMAWLIEKLKKETRLPLGVNVLWNDYGAALTIAKIFNLQFIRIPVFVDKVRTDCGIIEGRSKKIIEFKKSIGANNVALFTDIQVKHSELLSANTLIGSAKLAIKNHSDALIITGRWTGQAPTIEEVKSLRGAVNDFPIFIGSGIDKKNISGFIKSANGVIVSTSLKNGAKKKGEVNVKSYNQRIDKNKVRELVNKTKQ